MADKVLITKGKLDSLANTISSVSGSGVPLTISQMEDAVLSITPGEPSGDITHKADKDGSYDDMYVGTAGDILSEDYEEDTSPYMYRKTPVGVSRVKEEKIVGGSVVWNQLTLNADFSSGLSYWSAQAADLSVTSNVATLTITTAATHVALRNAITACDPNHVYLGLAQLKPNKDNTAIFYLPETNSATVDITANTWNTIGGVIKPSTSTYPTYNIYCNRSNTMAVGDTCEYRNIQLFDLTQMFGPVVANYIYSLEQATAGSGVKFFRETIGFNEAYYTYNAGELVSVSSLTAKESVGFNLWDEEWEMGTIDSSGINSTSDSRIRSKNYIPVIGGATYYCASSAQIWAVVYNRNKVIIPDAFNNTYWMYIVNQSGVSVPFTVPNEASYMRFVVLATTYNHDICINFSNTSLNGTYKPYEPHTYPLDTGLTLRGMPKVVDGGFTYDGDTYASDGTVTRKYGIVDLGTLTWGYSSNSTCFYSTSLSDKARGSNMFCSKYLNSGNAGLDAPDDSIAGVASTSAIYISDPEYSDAATFKTAMSGVYLVYELATPTSESATPYHELQIVDQHGTEEFKSSATIKIPVGHVSKYYLSSNDRIKKANEETLTIVANEYAKKIGTYDDLTVGTADQLLSDSYTEDTELYIYRKTPINATRVKEKIVGGSVVWNQLAKTISTSVSNNVTFTGSTDGKVTITGTLDSGQTQAFVNLNYEANKHAICTNHKYLILGPTSPIRIQIAENNGILATAFTDTIINVGEISGVSSWARIQFERYYETLNLTITPQIFDLTLMFGATVADYIYSLEQATANAGVKFVRETLGLSESYYPYNPGELVSVNKLVSKETVGKNLLDLSDWSDRTVSGITLKKQSDGTIKAFGSASSTCTYKFTTFTFKAGKTYILSGSPSTNVSEIFIRAHGPGYNEYTFNLIDTGTGRSITFDVDTTLYIDIRIGSGQTTDSTTIFKPMIRFASELDDTYEPYIKHTYPLDPDLTLRGIPKLVGNKVCYDGDTYEADGTVTRKYKICAMSSLSYGYNSDGGYFYMSPSDKAWGNQNLICTKYTTSAGTYVGDMADKELKGNGGNINCYIKDSSYSTLNDFVAGLAGHYIVYELATPTTEMADPYQEVQVVDPNGTEEFVSDATVRIPVGHETEYLTDLKGRLERLPDDFSTLIAPSEVTSTATRNYSIGNYLILNNVLYKVTSAITSGGTITPGTNVTATTIMAELIALT